MAACVAPACSIPFALPPCVCATCMQLHPLIEMYCRWELEVDCTNFEALMVRFNYMAELESNKLGRSLLFMVRDDEDGLHMYAQHDHRDAPPFPIANPFDVVRERLAAVDLAFYGLHPHVHVVLGFIKKCTIVRMLVVIFGWYFHYIKLCPFQSWYQ